MRKPTQDMALLGALAVAFSGAAAQAQESGSNAEPAIQSESESPATIPVTPAGEPETPTATMQESSPAPVGMRIEEVVVTAQRKAENVNDVPISITAFNGDDLKALGIADTRNLGNVVPGFTVANSGYNTPIYTLRGVGFNDSTYTATSTVGVYEDEVSLPYAIMTKGPALDLERLEVLKGPQGILYGRNTTGGAINYIAKRPTSDFEYGVSATGARFDTSEVEAYVSGNLIGSLNGRLAVKDVQAQEGWQYSNTRPDDALGKKDKQAFRAALDWQANDELSLRAVASGWRDHSEPQAAQVIQVREQNGLDPTGELFLPPQARSYPVIPVDGADPRVADWPDGEPWRLHDSLYRFSLRADWTLSPGTTLTTIASHLRVASENSSLPASGYNYNAFEQILNASIVTNALEARLAGSFGANDQVDWLAGGNVSRDKGFEDHIELADYQSALAPDPVTGMSTLTNRPEFDLGDRIDQIAGFVNAGFKVTDDLKLTAGGRYTLQDQHANACSFVSPTASYDLLSAVFTGISATDAAEYTAETGKPGQPSVVTTGECFSLAPDGSNARFVDELKEKNFSYRLAADWKPQENTLLYLSAGRGYKAGGFPAVGASSTKQFEPVTQERLLAYEAGTKVSWLDRQVHTNAAIYYYDYKNKQLLSFTKDPFFGPLPLLTNAPKSQVYGAEIDVQYAPRFVPGLFLTATGAYTHTEIKSYTGINSQGNEYDYAGRPFNFAPKVQATLVANYTIPVSEVMDMNLGADYSYTSETSSSLDPDPIFKHPAYDLIGARAGVTQGAWTMTAFGRNLANKLYTTTILAFGDSVHRYTGEPRTYGLTVSYSWK